VKYTQLVFIATVLSASCGGTRPIERKATKDLPAYTILMTQESGHYPYKHHGSVLIPSLSRETPVERREVVAQGILKAEDFLTVDLYSTENAFRAGYSQSFDKGCPDEYKKGYWGSFTFQFTGKYEFFAGEVRCP
jgi:hypothetical protein